MKNKAKKYITPKLINLGDLQTRIQYAFKDISLLGLVLRHKSKGKINNERLCALGNKLLELIIVDALYTRYPSFDEGRLTGISQRICCNYLIHDHARAIGLKIYAYNLPVSECGEALTDAFRALVAAIYIDGGLDAVREFILELRHFMKKNCNREPIYRAMAKIGENFAGHFTYAVLDDEVTIGIGRGSDPAEARTNAARVALDYLKPLYSDELEDETILTDESLNEDV